jgi:hypothetical protein
VAKAATLGLAVIVQGDGVNEQTLVASMTNAASPAIRFPQFPFVSGTTTFANTAATPLTVVLIPPPTSAVTKTLKQTGGDTGVTCAPNLPIIIRLAASSSNMQLVLSATETMSLELMV